jgi:ABC-type antimicrobial peptide transport system permease subunit
LFAEGPGVILGVSVLILAMGLIACGKLMRRALRIEPTDALRAHG